MPEPVIVVVVATALILTLSACVLAARTWLSPTGEAQILVNGRRSISARLGQKLLWALAENGILLPAACGGRGSCGQCRLRIAKGGGAVRPTESAALTRREIAAGWRLACAVTVRGNIDVQVPDDMLSARQVECTVRSSDCVATYLKELVLELPPDAGFEFQAGDYILLEAPAGVSRFAEFGLDPSLVAEWERAGYRDLVAEREQAEVRAYSIAGSPAEAGIVRLVVRIATPPAGASPNTPPGLVSSFVFGLAPGDKVTISGPFGEFHPLESDEEMVLIGGGAGIAPLRSILIDQLTVRGTRRTISLWYGARSRQDICFADEFDALASRYENFSWHVALSDSREDDRWDGPTGLIHAVVRDRYLADHPAPERAEYYLCGPPLMTSAVVAMLEDYGVDRDRIMLDDFGL